ncbi:unnamed protein product [Meloidogyne enterolobii]|uniref:Uncharacterized protein n=1 Tax=Meloidogyne enterolobii TaxID=390850 RepID=A0ACB0ZAZ9_MELEN
MNLIKAKINMCTINTFENDDSYFYHFEIPKVVETELKWKKECFKEIMKAADLKDNKNCTFTGAKFHKENEVLVHNGKDIGLFEVDINQSKTWQVISFCDIST